MEQIDGNSANVVDFDAFAIGARVVAYKNAHGVFIGYTEPSCGFAAAGMVWGVSHPERVLCYARTSPGGGVLAIMTRNKSADMLCFRVRVRA